MFELPKRKHLVHKAIEPRKLSKKVTATVEARTDDLWEVKYDGCCVILVNVAGVARAYSRQGETVAGAMDRQLKAMALCEADDYVLFAEAWHPDLIHSEINGDFRRGHEEGDERRLQAVIWDCVSLVEFMAGKSDRPFTERRSDCLLLADRLDDSFDTADGIGDLFLVAFQAETKARCESYVDAMKEVGLTFELDGFMRKSRNGHWTAGAGSCGSSLKDKELLVTDLKVESLVEGQGKFVGMLGAFNCTYKGKPQRVGGGTLTDAERLAIWTNQTRAEGGIGSIIEVNALGESTNGLLREPRFSRFRTDKTEGE